MADRIVLSVLALALAQAMGVSGPAYGDAGCPDPNSLVVIGGTELSDLDDLIERAVISADGQPVGTVKDIVLDACGTPATLVVALPDKDVAVPVDRVLFEPEGEELRIDGLSRSAIAALPAVDGSAVSLDRRTLGRGR